MRQRLLAGLLIVVTGIWYTVFWLLIGTIKHDTDFSGVWFSLSLGLPFFCLALVAKLLEISRHETRWSAVVIVAILIGTSPWLLAITLCS